MTETEWLERLNESAPLIRQLIADYHPGSWFGAKPKSLQITAEMPEAARQQVAADIATQYEESGYTTPLEVFDQALRVNDVSGLLGVMNEAWMGVPESTDCWKVAGFNDLVCLLEDPPEPP